MSIGGAAPLALVWELIALDKASPVFGRLSRNANVAATGMDRAIARFNKGARSMTATGAAMTRRLTLPIIAIAAVSAKAATDFNANMTRISTQAGGTAKDVGVLSKQVLGLAKYAEQGPNELASALYHLKSVGLGNVQAMKALRESVDLAAVGGANLEETTNSLAGAWRTGIRGAQNFHTAVATVNAIIGAGNMTMEDFNAALGTGILPTAKTFGLTLKDVGSALALFTDEGVPANAAATRLRMSFSLLGAPSAKAEKQLNSIGLTGLRLADDMRKPNGLIRAIGDLKAHIEDPKYKLSLSQQAQLLSHAFGGGRSSSAILSLINNFDVLKKKQNQVTLSLGKYDKAVAEQRATPEAKFKLLESSLQRAGILLGNQVIPLATSAAKKVGNIAEDFNSLSDGERKTILYAALALAALGPLLGILGRIGLAFGLMWKAGLGSARFIAGTRAATLSMEGMQSQAYLAGRGFRNLSGGVRALGGAMAGVASGALAGQVSGGGTKGWLESVIGGAAGGAVFGSVGGGIGAVTGAIVGGLSGAISHAIKLSNDNKGSWNEITATIQAANAAASTYVDLLKQSKGILNQSVKSQAGNALTTNGTLEQLNGLGFNPEHVINSVIKGGAPLNNIGSQLVNLAGQGKISLKTAQTLAAALDAESLAIGKAQGKMFALAEAQGKNVALTRSLAKETARYGTTLDSSTADGQANIAWIREHIRTVAVDAAAMLRHGKSAAQVKAWYDKQTGALGTLLAKSGVWAKGSQQDIDGVYTTLSGLISLYGGMPKSVTTALKVEQTAALQKIGNLQARIDRIRQGKVPGLNADSKRGRATIRDLEARINAIRQKVLPSLGLNPDAALGAVARVQTAINSIYYDILHPPKAPTPTPVVGKNGSIIGLIPGGATGGAVRGPGTGRSDSILARLSNGEHILDASDVRKAGGQRGVFRMRAAIQAGRLRFADGGPVGFSAPSPRLSSIGGGGRGVRPAARVLGGTVALDVDSSGRFMAHIRDLVVDESEFGGTLERMHR